MAEDKIKTGAKVNGVESHIARVQLAEGHQSVQGLATGTGTLQDATRDENNPSTSKKRTFKSVVKHHFVKDKLFVLVNELLKSADEERQAQEELIASFQTAREVTGPIRRQALSAASHRTKRRRKRADTPLIERIEQTRKESREPLEGIEIYNKNASAVGHMKISASEESKYEHLIEIPDESKHDSVKNKMKPNRFTEAAETENDTKTDSMNCKENVDLEENDQPRTRRRSKSVPAGETEKLSVIYELHRDENTSEVDKLILDSLLHDNDNFETQDSRQVENNMERENHDTAKKDDESSSDVTVAVESNTESDEDEANVKVIGSNDEIEEGESGDDTPGFRNEDEIEKVKDSNMSASELNRIPASIHPTLGTIAEASSESFQTLPSSARDSSSIIEIEAKKSKLPWRADSGGSAYNDTVKTDTFKNRDNGNTSKGSSSIGDPSDQMGVRKDIWIISSDDNESSNVHDKIKREKTVKDGKRPTSVHYEHSDRLDDEHIHCKEKSDIKVKPEKHSNRSPKSGTKKKRDYEIERSKSELELQHKSKSTRRISLDLLDVYEENTDLQRVSMSEIKPSKQHLVRKGKLSPKRSRSKSPTKKRSRETKKNDMKPLSPKITSSSNSNGRNNPFLTLYRSKTELSSRGSSTSSFDDKTTSGKTLQNLKDERRYRKPDYVLWERLDISEGCPKDKKNALQWSGDFDFEANHRYSGLIESNARQNGGIDGRRVTWNVPLNEAIKKLTGSKNVPDISKISHSVPRDERIGRLYIDLKQERRASGFTEYRRLKTPDHREEIDEFTHL